ncbi:MAG: glutamate--tRNA ligase [Gammaproteobacteria bacterium]|nr:glutamate--tRNA ligase [Gammaproteobacteria bacterium]
MMIRTRFAPSPTGDLHIGSVRTALYSYLYARHYGGEFFLRIEDTDAARSTELSLQSILEGMAWLGLKEDGDVRYQSKRQQQYHQAVDKLMASGHAYRCYCSKERLDSLRAQQMAEKQKPRYDGYCRDHQQAQQDAFVIRFKNPQSGSVTFADLVLGEIEINQSELDDLILLRSDGSPTYNLTVVVDDSEMAISHVIRGMDHVNNTPKQINLFRALGIEPPIYGHLPMIHGSDGKKLSKRHGAVSVMQYRHEGYLPQALINYLLRLGWSHGDQEIFSQQEMVEWFDGSCLSRSPAVFDYDKLQWLNQHYLKTFDSAVIVTELQHQFERLAIDTTQGPPLTEVIAAQAERVKTLHEMAERSRYFYQAVEQYDEKAAKKNLNAEILPWLPALIERLQQLSQWDKNAIHDIVKEIAAEFDLKLGKVAQPIRVALTGNTTSPPIDLTLELLGREQTIQRLLQAKAWVAAKGL